MVEQVNNAQNVQELISIFQECYDLKTLKHSINQQIYTLNENQTKSMYYKSVSIESILPTDILQNVLSFNHLDDIKSVSKTFKTCMNKNKHQLNKQEYLKFNVNKIDSMDETVNMLKYVRDKKVHLINRYKQMRQKHKDELRENIGRIKALRRRQRKQLNEMQALLQDVKFDKRLDELTDKFRELAVKENKNAADLCMACGKLSGFMAYPNDCYYCECCDKLFCGDCRDLYKLGEYRRGINQFYQLENRCIDCDDYQFVYLLGDYIDRDFYRNDNDRDNYEEERYWGLEMKFYCGFYYLCDDCGNPHPLEHLDPQW